MKTITTDFDELSKTLVTVFEGLEIEEILSFMRLVLKPTALTTHPFVKRFHAYQMRRSVYDMSYDTAYYIIERVFKDEDGDIAVTLIEHTEGGYCRAPETVEWTFDIDYFLHAVVGLDPFYHWGE